jgi:folate-dependent tRNA-U54 methylase TrmFO/GidA
VDDSTTYAGQVTGLEGLHERCSIDLLLARYVRSMVRPESLAARPCLTVVPFLPQCLLRPTVSYES